MAGPRVMLGGQAAIINLSPITRTSFPAPALTRALLNGEGRYKQAFRRGVLLHQALQGFRYLMD